VRKVKKETFTVMVVDDNDSMRELIGMHLRIHGYEVVEASDGSEAVELVRRACPALILMDINMPVMDGLEATRLIRAIKDLCRMPIVAISAYGEGGDNRQMALAAGCDEYISKTKGISELPSIVERHLRTI
jgi:two-component system cell cycle response regulator DivK